MLGKGIIHIIVCATHNLVVEIKESEGANSSYKPHAGVNLIIYTRKMSKQISELLHKKIILFKRNSSFLNKETTMYLELKSLPQQKRLFIAYSYMTLTPSLRVVKMQDVVLHFSQVCTNATMKLDGVHTPGLNMTVGSSDV